MDNTKSFKENYKYNAKKIMQIIEESRLKQADYIKAETTQKKEKE